MSGAKPLALVTGGAQGIGAAITYHLASEGWQVVAADKNIGSMQACDKVIPIACDVSQESEVERLIRDIDLQEGKLDALVCNAGIMKRKPLAEMSLDDWNAVLATNLTSMFLLAKAAEAMLRKAKGSIVTLASTRAHMSEPDTESYAASKGGIVALTHALSVSLGPDVRANCISPGWINSANEDLRDIDHSQHPAGRVGTVGDIARAVAFFT